MMLKRFLGILGTFLVLFSAVAYQSPDICDGASEEKAIAGSNGSPQYSELEQAVSATLEQEKSSALQLKDELAQTKAAEKEFNLELDVYRIQVSTHNNLLSIPDAEVKNLEKADALNRLTIENVKARATGLVLKKERFEQLGRQNDQSYQANEQQLARIRSEAGARENSRALIAALKALLETLTEKRTVLEKLSAANESRMTALQEILGALSELSGKLTAQIQLRKKQALFERVSIPLATFHWREVGEDLNRVRERLRLVMTGAYWRGEADILLGANGEWPVAGTLFFLAVCLFLFRARRLCDRSRPQSHCDDTPWRQMGLMILSRSLPVMGVTLFVYLAARIYHYDTLPIIRMVVSILSAFLFTRWALDFFTLMGQQGKISLFPRHLSRLKTVLLFLRWIAVVYSVADYLAVGAGFLLTGGRLILWMGLFIFGLVFFEKMKGADGVEAVEVAGSGGKWVKIPEVGVLCVIGAGVLLELAGYGAFALYWQVSWARSAVVVLLALIAAMALKEWDQQLRHSHETDDPDVAKGQPIQWIFSRIGWLVWIVSVTFSLLFAWGASKALIGGLFRVFEYPLAVGQMHFSLMGLFYAVLILFLVQLLTRIFRYLLKEKVLNTDGLEFGLKESIITISTYLIWGIGILIALHAFGLNTASLTVALGGLGIGLGFGLQNIFNNFISGIILLFERPIQVGDDVEIAGTWATVKKINVRSTVVQTVDNASLIIPNSEFVSSQVTNWSFKDKRLRRKINVGVAYGSDIELVRKTLIEIAEKTRNTLKSPKPEVLFTDFGDSALLFQLRFWTTIPHMLTTATEVRFEINRLFAERNLTIAFPQMDIHLHREGDGDRRSEVGPSSAVDLLRRVEGQKSEDS